MPGVKRARAAPPRWPSTAAPGSPGEKLFGVYSNRVEPPVRDAHRALTIVKAVALALVVAAANWVLAVLAFFAEIAGPIGGDPPWWANVLAPLWFLLGFPATYIIGRWTPSLMELSNRATLAITGASSLLWGIATAALWLWWRSRRRRARGGG